MAYPWLPSPVPRARPRVIEGALGEGWAEPVHLSPSTWGLLRLWERGWAPGEEEPEMIAVSG